MNSNKMQATARMVEAGDAARRKVVHEMEARNASRWEKIRGLVASHRARQ